MSLIACKDVSYWYEGRPQPALNHVSFTVEQGEYIALVGRNGSGKSTLVRLINGLRTPSSGSIRVLGMDPADPEHQAKVRASIAMVFQSPADQIVTSCVEEDIAFGPENLGLPRTEIAARVDEALEMVGLTAFRTRPTRFLSGGQLQKLALAGAIAMRPRCIVFDEATSMLDPRSRKSLLELMDTLKNQGITVIHVTHEMEEAARASRVILLDQGELVFDGSPARFFSVEACSVPGAPSGISAPASHNERTPPDSSQVTLPELYGLELPVNLRFARMLGLSVSPGTGPAEIAVHLMSSLAAARPYTRQAAAPSGISPSAQIRKGDDDGDRAFQHPGTQDSAEPDFMLSDVHYHYLSGTMFEYPALQNITMAIPRGAKVAFIGHAGSGKSTCLQLLNALLVPTKGEVRSLGVNTREEHVANRLRSSVPLAIQRPETALFETFTGDDVAFGPRNLGITGAQLVERVRTWMNAAGLSYEEFRDRQIRTLSGGEKRRAALAGVFAMESRAILLDEPSAALDPQTRTRIWSIINRASERGSTVVFATHAMEEAAGADLVGIFHEGRLVAFGLPSQIFGEHFDPAWNIERPFLYAMLHELSVRGFRLPSRPGTLEELAALLLPMLGRGGGAGADEAVKARLGSLHELCPPRSGSLTENELTSATADSEDPPAAPARSSSQGEHKIPGTDEVLP